MIESKLKAKNCDRGQLFRPCWISSARCSKLWSNQLGDWYSQTHTKCDMEMTSDETQIQIFAHWPMSHAKRVTRDNRKNPEYRVVAAIRKQQTDTNCPAGKSWPNHVWPWLRSFASLCFSCIFGAVDLFRSDMLLIFDMVWIQGLHQIRGSVEWVWARCKSSLATDLRAFRSQALRDWWVAPPRRSVR